MRLLGGAMVALGVLAFWAPMVIGGWSLALLSIPMATLSVAEARATFASPRCAEVSAYLPSLFAMLGAAAAIRSTDRIAMEGEKAIFSIEPLRP